VWVSDWSWTDWQVGGGNTETMDGVSGVTNRLQKTIGIYIAVTSMGDSMGIFSFLSGRQETVVAESVSSPWIVISILETGCAGNDEQRHKSLQKVINHALNTHITLQKIKDLESVDNFRQLTD
jgi:hypothetical protein